MAIDKLKSGALNLQDDVAVDTDTLFVDVSTDRVGIGTSSPSTDLDVTTSGGQVNVDSNGHITSKQFLDAITAGGRIIGKTNRGIVSQIDLAQTAAGADGGYISFLTCNVGSTSPTERMRLLAGGGLTFNGDTAAANGLDDYEIGSFAPVYAISGGSVTTGTNAGRYVKVGDFVFFTFRLRTTAVSGTGALSMTLPFASSTENRSGGSRGYARDWGVDMPEFTIYTPPSSSVAFFYRHAMNVSTALEVTGSQMGTGGDDNVLEGSIVYRSA